LLARSVPYAVASDPGAIATAAGFAAETMVVGFFANVSEVFRKMNAP
jgi:hypothetical protein